MKPAASAGRKARAVAALPARNPLRTFTLFVGLPTVAVYVVVCLLAFATLHVMSGEINRVDGDRGRKSIAAAVGAIPLQLAEQVADEAAWTDAYINTYVDFSPAWLDRTWGATARDEGHYDTVIVTDATGRVIFGESGSLSLADTVAQSFSGARETMQALDRAIADRGDKAAVAVLSRGGDGVFALAAAVIRGATGQAEVPPERRRLLWLARQVDETVLAYLARHFKVPVPHLVAGAAPGADLETLALRDAADEVVGTLAWRPLRPGDAVFMHAASIASIVLLIVGSLLFVVLTAFRRSVERRAESDERDWLGARYDASTGLLSRFGLEEAVAGRIRRRDRDLNVALVHVELEGLKDVAGSYGEETAEALLDHLCDLIDEALESQAYLARLGSDELALCCTGEQAGDMARHFADTIFELLSEAIPLDELRLRLGASIGIAEARVTRRSMESLFRQAAAALQRARETGGNHVVVHAPSLDSDRQQRLALQADIRRGLDAEEFDLDYQPIFDFETQSMLGVEALLRWPRRAGGAMSPAEFIPAAETSGLIEELGLYALRRACRDIAHYPQLKLSVNVSTVQFRSPNLASRIDAILSSTGFLPERLQLEITESFLLDQPDRAKAAIEELRGRGITIALDDFGTGFSSVGYLRQFSFDRVKLDRSLVDGVDRDAVKAALVESTMVVAFAMGLSVTAEGVERREEAAVLARLGCREFQGYLFSRPISLGALDRLVKQDMALSRAS